MTVGSLFAGIGGFDLGFERAGFKTLWQVEIDENCNRVLEKNFPDAERFRDIHECGAHNLKPVDVITGGFPCQPFSSATRGRKLGTADNRWLWPEMYRVIGELRPAWACIENVAQFDGPALKQVAAEMEAIGYEVGEPLEIPACAFGHDHWRARLWILCHSNGDRKPSRAINAEAPRMSRSGSDARSVGAANGLPGRMDRLRMLGNSVCPQIAQWIAEGIREEL